MKSKEKQQSQEDLYKTFEKLASSPLGTEDLIIALNIITSKSLSHKVYLEKSFKILEGQLKADLIDDAVSNGDEEIIQQLLKCKKIFNRKEIPFRFMNYI